MKNLNESKNVNQALSALASAAAFAVAPFYAALALFWSVLGPSEYAYAAALAP